jgi:hypothetical protein
MLGMPKENAHSLLREVVNLMLSNWSAVKKSACPELKGGKYFSLYS